VIHDERPVIQDDGRVDPNQRPVIDNERPVILDDGPVDPNQRPVIDNERPAILDDGPVDPNQRPVIDNERPAILDDGPVDPNERPVIQGDGPVDPNEMPRPEVRSSLRPAHLLDSPWRGFVGRLRRRGRPRRRHPRYAAAIFYCFRTFTSRIHGFLQASRKSTGPRYKTAPTAVHGR
jgi:hypothetical protein